MPAEINGISCPNCASGNVKKSGVRGNRLQSFQRYFCRECKKTFTLSGDGGGKTFPLRVVLNAVSLYNKGHSQAQTAELLGRRFHAKPSQKTISNWLGEYGGVCTFAKLRAGAVELFEPKEIMEVHEFMHNNLPYRFMVHRAKMELLFRDTRYNNKFSDIGRLEKPLKGYFAKIPTQKFPHHIFAPKGEEEKLERSSQIGFETLPFVKKSKNNLANKLCGLALNLARSNRERHGVVQEFMLTNDSSTVACEVPVYLTNDDIAYFNGRGFVMPFPVSQKTPITGHIDVVQVRNGQIHILDYKPEAGKVNAVNQLTTYALALASRTKLMVRDFRCAWFDDQNYYEFAPLHAVYEKREKQAPAVTA